MRPFLAAVLFSLVAALPLRGAEQFVGPIDTEFGFLGVSLRCTPAALPSAEVTEDIGRFVTYKDKREKIRYAGLGLAEVRYNFLWGKLYSIHIDVEGARNVRGILKALVQQYGTEFTLETRNITAADTVLETREWKGKRAYLLYKNAKNGKGGQIIVVDRAEWDKMQVPREQMVRENLKWMQGSFSGGDFDVRPSRP